MPLIGAQGPGSQMAWRGNLDEYPDQFQFPAVVEVQPGSSGISTEVVITGINYKALVTAVGSAASISVTPYQEATDDYGTEGDFLPGNDSNNPIIIRNKDKLKLKIETEAPVLDTDYGRIYATDIKIGKRPESTWSVTTKLVDNDPDTFSFNSKTGLEISDDVASNTVTITGIDATVGADVFMRSPTGEVRIAGGSPTRSGIIFPGQGLDIVDTTSGFYSTEVETEVQVGTYVTTFSHSTRVVDTSIDSFTFSSITNSDIETSQESSSITISGADPSINNNNPLPISITSGGEYKVTRNGRIVQEFTSASGTVENGDVITVRLTSSAEYSAEVSTTLTISNQSSTFRVTTRPRPINTIPDQFSFNSLFNQGRGVNVTSNEITLAGMTAFGDEGTASISGTSVEFKVVRDNVIVRDYHSDSFPVQLGDKISLRVTTSPNSLGEVSAIFTVAGRTTFDVLSGVNGSTTSVWRVISAQRICTVDVFDLPNKTGNAGELQPGELASVSFTASGFDSDCGMTATTSDRNSYLKIGSREGSTLDNVNIGDTIEVYMSTPYYDQTRTTTVTLTSSFGTSRSVNWTIGPVSPPLPELDLDAEDRHVEFVFPDGGTAVLTYVYNYVTNATVTTNFGVTTIPVNTLSTGSRNGTITKINLPAGTTNYSMTVSNSTGSFTDNVNVLVGSPPNPTITLCPSDTSSCSNVTTKDKGSNIRLYWKTTNAVRTESPDFSTRGKQNGNILISNLREDDKVYTITAIGAGNPAPTATATHRINLRPFINISSNKSSIILGESITLSWESDHATEVVSTSGFSTEDLNGSVVITPTSDGNFTFGISVSDEDGVRSSDSVTIDVIEDRSPFGFNLSSDNLNNLNNLNPGQKVEIQPSFSQGNSRSLGGLSPGVSLVARLSGPGNPKFFKNNSKTLTVQNGTPSSDLRFHFNASNNFEETFTVKLAIGDKSDSISASTKTCVVENTTETLDGMTFNMRRCFQFDSNNRRILNKLVLLSVNSNNQIIQRNGGGGNSGSVSYKPGTYEWIVPSGIDEATFEAIGGGGAGSSADGSGGGGAGAARAKGKVKPGEKYIINVGSGGKAQVRTIVDGENTSILRSDFVNTSNIVFVSVIDEVSTSASTIQNDWNNFRTLYGPDAPFYILWPTRNSSFSFSSFGLFFLPGIFPISRTDYDLSGAVSVLKIPSNYISDKFAFDPIIVNRDNGSSGNASDWFELMDFSRFPKGTMVSLSIDNSGSMRTSTVQSSSDNFKRRCKSSGLMVVDSPMGSSERWAKGHTDKNILKDTISLNSFDGFGATQKAVTIESNRFYDSKAPLSTGKNSFPSIIAIGGKGGRSAHGVGKGSNAIASGFEITGGSGTDGREVSGPRSSRNGGSGGDAGKTTGGRCVRSFKIPDSKFSTVGGAGGGGSQSGGKCNNSSFFPSSFNFPYKLGGEGAKGLIYGGGGGGGANSKIGGDGGDGFARISWEPSFTFPPYTKSQVVNTIIKVYWDDAGRPPTYDQVKVYYNLFKDRPDVTGTTLSEFETYMKKGVGDFKNTRVEDNCGNPFPRLDKKKVTFTVERNASFRNTIVFELQSGSGPQTLSFGPNASVLTTDIQLGSVYKLKSVSINGKNRNINSVKLRTRSNINSSTGEFITKLKLEDSIDNDYNDLIIKTNVGRFIDTQTYQL